MRQRQKHVISRSGSRVLGMKICGCLFRIFLIQCDLFAGTDFCSWNVFIDGPGKMGRYTGVCARAWSIYLCMRYQALRQGMGVKGQSREESKDNRVASVVFRVVTLLSAKLAYQEMRAHEANTWMRKIRPISGLRIVQRRCVCRGVFHSCQNLFGYSTRVALPA